MDKLEAVRLAANKLDEARDVEFYAEGELLKARQKRLLAERRHAEALRRI